jgi:hypothetical protein
MKVTYEFIINYLIAWYKHKENEQAKDLHQKQLEILTNVLDIPNNIRITTEGLEFDLKEGEYINEQHFKKELKEAEKEELLQQITKDINNCLSHITRYRKVRDKNAKSIEVIDRYYQIIEAERNDFALVTFGGTLKDIYIKSIKSCLEVLYGTNFKTIGKHDHLQGWNINSTIENKEAQKLLSIKVEDIQH